LENGDILVFRTFRFSKELQKRPFGNHPVRIAYIQIFIFRMGMQELGDIPLFSFDRPLPSSVKHPVGMKFQQFCRKVFFIGDEIFGGIR